MLAGFPAFQILNMLSLTSGPQSDSDSLPTHHSRFIDCLVVVYSLFPDTVSIESVLVPKFDKCARPKKESLNIAVGINLDFWFCVN